VACAIGKCKNKDFIVYYRVPRWIFEAAGICDQIAWNCGKTAGNLGKFEKKIAGALIKLTRN
jgi:hypothetical protein